jgi:hypothetical protein
MTRSTGDQRVTEIKDLIEWAIAPIVASIVWLGGILRGQAHTLSTHQTRIAVLEHSRDAENELRTEQRTEIIETITATNTKIDTLADRINDVLVEVAKK